MKDNMVKRAALFAQMAHEGHKRKYTGEPYVNHLREVATLVSKAGLSEAAIAAAWLHDTLEDTAVTRDQLEKAFGLHVTRLVVELTDVSKKEDGNRAIRKELDRQHLAGASAEAQSIKLADLISNMVSITKHDPHFARVYVREKERLLDVLTRGNRTLYTKAVAVLVAAKRNLGMYEKVS